MVRAAWLVDGSSPGAVVARLDRNDSFAEAHLETWIAQSPDLILDGIDWIARQLVFSDDQSRLDLLGKSPDDEWVVVELKRGRLSRDALMQALHYVLHIGAMSSSELRQALETNEYFRTRAEAVRQGVHELLDAESDGTRRVSIVLAGTSRTANLDLAVQFLQDHGLDLTINVVTYDLFTTSSAQTVLVRDVDELVSPSSTEGQDKERTVNAVLAKAADSGVSAAFSEFIAVAGVLQLRVKAHTRAVTITGRAQGNPTILYLRPESDHLHIWLNGENAARFLELTAEDLAVLGGPGGHNLSDEDATKYAQTFREVVRHRRATGPDATSSVDGGPEPED
jgi:hypothetical protein